MHKEAGTKVPSAVMTEAVNEDDAASQVTPEPTRDCIEQRL